MSCIFQASSLLKELHTRHLARKYCRKLSKDRKQKFQLKILAETLFQGKKKSYPSSFPNWFKNERINEQDREFVKTFGQSNGEKVLVCIIIF